MTEPRENATESDAPPLRRILLVAAVALGVGATAVVASSSLRKRPATSGQSTPRAPLELGQAEQSAFDDDGRGLQLRRQQRARLESYGWIDEKEGYVHIPIARACELELERRR